VIPWFNQRTGHHCDCRTGAHVVVVEHSIKNHLYTTQRRKKRPWTATSYFLSEGADTGPAFSTMTARVSRRVLGALLLPPLLLLLFASSANEKVCNVGCMPRDGTCRRCWHDG
jgi:hypothetical protein